MIWLHCGDRNELGLTRSILALLGQLAPDRDILVTGDQDILFALRDYQSEMQLAVLPEDAPAQAKDFLDRYNPTSLAWLGGTLQHNLLQAVDAIQIPGTLVNARSTTLFPRRSLWVPGSVRAAVAAFSRIMTADGVTATRLLRGGVPHSKIQATGTILEEPMPLDHDPNELTVVMEALQARPVWLAAEVLTEEIGDLIKAHTAAMRKNHRLLMVLTPRDPSESANAVASLRASGLATGLRSDMDDPHPEQQAYVADMPDEAGLWYRAAPVTFAGGSFSKAETISPLEPLTLGSAVVHGPQKAPNETRFQRLQDVGACREVRSANELGTALTAMTTPEDSARMAVAGWDEMTRNAHLINDIIRRALHEDEVVG